MSLIRCLIYLALIGAAGFILGRLLPKRLFRADRPPFKLLGWEQGGRIYEKVGVKAWKDKVPDMSAILPKLMPSKKLPKEMTPAVLERMIQETCVAEWIHGLLALLGFGCVFLWKGVWGWIASVLYLLGNLPDIIIQRYNRPKLLRIYERARARESANETRDHFELQHGTGA